MAQGAPRHYVRGRSQRICEQGDSLRSFLVLCTLGHHLSVAASPLNKETNILKASLIMHLYIIKILV